MTFHGKHPLPLWWIIAALLCLSAFFVHSNVVQPDIMEQRNIITAREMVYEGHWMVPTMNGELRLEKPPLPTWAAGFIEMIRPYSLGAQRTAAGIMACLWVWWLYLLTLYVSRRRETAVVTAAVFITSYAVIFAGRSAMWDIWCHSFMAGACYHLLRGLTDSRRQRSSLLWAGVLMGLSFMSKGPIAFYATLLPFLIAMCLTMKPQVKGRKGALVLMTAIAVVISCWWYAYILLRHPEAMEAVASKETGAWASRHARPFWHYWKFASETGVWTFLTMAALAIPYWRRRVTDRQTYLFGITWLLACLIILSLPPEKKTRYLLPIMPACAIAVGTLLTHFATGALHKEKGSRYVFLFNGYLTSLLILALPAALWWLYSQDYIGLAVMITADVLLLALAFWTAQATHQLHTQHFLAGIILLFVVIEWTVLPAVGRFFDQPYRPGLEATRQDSRLQGINFYQDKNADKLRIQLVYYAGRKILPLDLEDTTAVMQSMPCAVVSLKPTLELPEAVLQKADTILIGRYDDNSHRKTTRRYSDTFITYVTLITPKQHE